MLDERCLDLLPQVESSNHGWFSSKRWIFAKEEIVVHVAHIEAIRVGQMPALSKAYQGERRHFRFMHNLFL